jgi:hypothetical protein
MLHYERNAHGVFTPATVAPPMRYPPGYYIIIAERRGGMGGQHGPLNYRTTLYFHIKTKGILRSKNTHSSLYLRITRNCPVIITLELHQSGKR